MIGAIVLPTARRARTEYQPEALASPEDATRLPIQRRIKSVISVGSLSRRFGVLSMLGVLGIRKNIIVILMALSLSCWA